MYKKVLDVIARHERFLISAHVNPDPDALCSEMAMALFLKALGKKVTIVNEAAVPERFQFLPGIKIVKSWQEGKRLAYDCAVILDCGDVKRIGKVGTYLQANRPLINIDHHVTNTNFGDVNCVMTTCSSTCETLYELFKRSKCALSKNMSLHLYAGIMTDTGSFRYENTTARTHAIAAELLKYKFSPLKVYHKLYEMMPLSDVEAFTKMVNRFEPLYKGKVISVMLSKKLMAKFSKDFDLRDTMFKFLRCIQGVEVVVIFTEAEKKMTRVNFRSIEKVDVAAVANHFGGGGHVRASGCQVNQDMKSTREVVLKTLKRLV